MTIHIKSVAVVAATFALLMGSAPVLAAESDSAEEAARIADAALEEDEKAKNDNPEGVKCKRVRRTGSNRLVRRCTTAAQREEAERDSLEYHNRKSLEREREQISAAQGAAGKPG